MTKTDQSNVSLQWLKPSQLDVEPLAQREYAPANTERIVKAFDPEKIGELKVTERDGRFWVTDGQHRRAALIEKGLGDQPVPCVVRVGRSIGEDAKSFVAANVETRRTTGIDAFRVQLVAGDAESVAIQQVLDRFGLKVAYNWANTTVSAVSALQWVYRRGGESLLVRTLTMIEATWGHERAGRDGNILKAYALLLDRVGYLLDLDSLADKVQRDSTPAKLIGTARTHRGATGKALYAQIADVLVTIYNKGRSSKRVSLA